MPKAKTGATTPKSLNTAPPQKSLHVNSVEIKNFKRVSQASIKLSKITYLVGGNNSGKSSILQAIHTAFSCARLSLERGIFKQKSSGQYSIDPSKVLPDVELLYRPTASFIHLGHGEPYRAKGNNSGEVRFTGFNAESNKSSELTVLMYKAHNHNNAGVELQDDVANEFKFAIYDDSTLFSVYVPGLTGIPLYEEYKSLGVIRRTAAGGEANLVFRNILYHLTATDLRTLEKLLEQIFSRPAKFDIRFEPKRDQYIDAKLSLGEGDPISVDLWGTGVLQVTQILAYALLFRPKLFLIDEPDSHLHPTLQRTLASTFKAITDTLECRIIITTHSRHMLSAAPEGTRVVWMKDGRVENSDAKEIVEVLLDLGALDSFDSQAAYILYTEDSNRSALTDCIKFLEEKGRVPHINILPFNGKKNTQLLASIDTGTQVLNQERRLILHRDRDFLTEEEIQTWGKPYEDGRRVGSDKTGQPTGQLDPMLVFIPKLNDTESYYCQPDHLQTSLGISRQDAQQLVSRIVHENEDVFKEIFWKEREAANNSDALWPDGGSPRTDELWDPPKIGEVNWQILQGKKLLKLLAKDPTVSAKASKIKETPSAALAEEFLSFFKSHFSEE